MSNVSQEPGIENNPGSAHKNWAARLCFGLVGAAWLFHFTVIGLSLMPDNPLNHQYKLQMYSYIEPFFGQNWSLFAPNPINSNMVLLLQYQYYEDGVAQQTQWVDIMHPLIQAKRENFWSPAQRISKFMTGVMQNVTEHNRAVLEHIEKTDSLASDSLAAARFYHEANQRAPGHRSILLYASYVYRNMAVRDELGNPDSVLVRYKIHDSVFPRFSQRHLDYFDLDNYQFRKMTSVFHPVQVSQRPVNLNLTGVHHE